MTLRLPKRHAQAQVRHLPRCMEPLRDFIRKKGVERGESFYIGGPAKFWSAKTEAAAAVARYEYRRHKRERKRFSCDFVLASQFFENIIQGAFRSGDDFWEDYKKRYSEVDLLVIDGLGIEARNGRQAAQVATVLAQVLRVRYEEMVSTIITSSFKVGRLESVYSREVFSIISSYEVVRVK